MASDHIKKPAIPKTHRNTNSPENIDRYKHGATAILELAEQEIMEIDSSNLPEDLKAAHRYKATRVAFDAILEDSKTYRNILKSVKSSYEDYIDSLEQNVENSITLSSKLKNLAARPTTFSNLRKRSDQLEANLEYLKKQNAKLTEEIDKTDEEQRESTLASKSAKEFKLKPSDGKVKDTILNELSIPDSMNEEKLAAYLKTVRKELEVLKGTMNEKYITKKEHDDVWSTYMVKAEQKNVLENTYKDLRKELYFITVANNTAKGFLEKEPIGKTMSEAVYESLVEAVTGSIRESLLDDTSDGVIFEDEDTENTINYIEHFHILFDEGRYEQAAIHAAQSHKGVLRSDETFRKFKEAQEMNPEKPIMCYYAKAFMGTVSPDFTKRGPTEEMCIAFVNAVLKQGEEKLIYQWSQNGTLKSSKTVADLLACNKHSKVHGTVVAEDIYMRLGMHQEAIRCMAYRGDIPAAVSFAQQTAQFTRPDYIDLILSVPSVKLAMALSVHKDLETKKVLLPCGQVALLLLKDDHLTVVGEFLKTLDLREGDMMSDSSEFPPNSIFSDLDTTEEDWLHVVKMLENSPYEEVGVDIITSITTSKAMKRAISDIV